MGSAVELYEKLASAPDEKTRARLIAEAFERMEERYPEITDLATQTQLSETELRLKKEIEQLRADTHEMDARLTKEIEQLRADTHAMDARLTKEIEQLRADTHAMDARLTKEIEQVRAELKYDIEQLRSDMHAMDARIHEMDGRLTKEIAQAKVETIKWTGGFLLIQLALLGALIKLIVG